MTDRWPLLLTLLSISLLSAGCQETSAPAAPSAEVKQADGSGGERASLPVDSSPDPQVAVEDIAAPATSDTKPADKPKTPPPAPAETRDYSFDDLKFEMEKGGKFERQMLTDKIEAMVDTSIRIRGYILPSFQQTGLKQFVLVRDNMECCFGPGAALFDCILVEMNEGKSANFSVRPVAVEGKFSINEFIGPDGKHLAIYHLQGEAVK